MALFNLARMTVSSSGTGTITLNAAVSGFLTFDAAGCSTAASGQAVTYAIGDTTQSEIASGTYFSSSITLTRGSSLSGLKSTNSNSPINMSNAAQVIITPQAAGVIGRVNVQSFTASGTYTPTTGLIVAQMECVGGGGGGGGVDGFAPAVLAGGGGGGGSYALTVSLSSAIGTSQTVTVGAGGAGGVTVGGSSGGTTSVGSLCVAPGGSGGGQAANLTSPSGGAGGVAGTGTITVLGCPGSFGYYNGLDASTFGVVYVPTGAGGNSPFGPGAASVIVDLTTTTSANGTAATANTGGGGSGGGMFGVENTANGGAGGSGRVVIFEYCSL